MEVDEAVGIGSNENTNGNGNSSQGLNSNSNDDGANSKSGANVNNNNNNTLSVPNIILEGYLKKRSIKKHNVVVSALSGLKTGNVDLNGNIWQRRYFVLDDKKVLSYFSEGSDNGKLRGCIQITNDSNIGLNQDRAHAFELSTPHVKFMAQAESDEDRDRWIGAIQTSIRELQRDKQSKQLQKIKRKAQEVKKGKKTGRGTHTFMASGTQFEVDTRYEFKRVVGKGAYGVVVAVHDKVTGQDVAIKKVTNVFDNMIDAKRILREITILRHLKHNNISKILDIMRPPPVLAPVPQGSGQGDMAAGAVAGSANIPLLASNSMQSGSIKGDDFNDVYIVLELMDTDLHRVIYSTQQLFDQHIQYLLFQLLSACHYLASCNVIHRDLKPSNILVNSACNLRVCDFGLARSMDDNAEDQAVTVYVVTRWYRAPELLLSYADYTEAIDIWSVGCIFAELLGRKPLFPGEDYLKQLNLIAEVLGTPSDDDIAFLGAGSTARYLQEMAKRPKIPWKQVPQLSNAPDLALDLLDKMLTFDPYKRITAEEALRHPYLQVYHGQPLEVCTEPFTLDDIESKQLTKKELRDAIMKEIEIYRPGGYPV